MGLILYIAIILGLNIAYASSLLYQFNVNPFSKYLYEADYVLRYLTYTQEYAIEYSLYNSDKSSFIAVNNTSFVDNPATKKST